jgi:hypothetical protein
MSICLRRRDFIAGLGGAAAWPLAARAQQGDRVRRIGVLMGPDENEPVAKPQLSAFTQALAGLGWTDGRNVRLDLRWGRADINRIRALAQELVGLQPDIIVTNETRSWGGMSKSRETDMSTIRKVRLTVLTRLAVIMTASVPATAQQQPRQQTSEARRAAQQQPRQQTSEARRAAIQRCNHQVWRVARGPWSESYQVHLLFVNCMTAAGFQP